MAGGEVRDRGLRRSRSLQERRRCRLAARRSYRWPYAHSKWRVSDEAGTVQTCVANVQAPSTTRFTRNAGEPPNRVNCSRGLRQSRGESLLLASSQHW